MFIVVNKKDKLFINSDNEVHFWENGYPVLTNKDIAFSSEDVDIFEVTEIPEGVIPFKYCYTEEKGFYVNPNWIEPDSNNTYGIPDETYHSIIDDYTSTLVESEVI